MVLTFNVVDNIVGNICLTIENEYKNLLAQNFMNLKSQNVALETQFQKICFLFCCKRDYFR